MKKLRKVEQGYW